MMSFTITGAVQEVYRCDDCGWIQTKKHFVSDANGPLCSMCNGPASQLKEIQPSTGMSDFKYRELLAALEENADGVGAATVENIKQHFEEGNDFLDAVKAAHQKMEYDKLKKVDGVGKTSAKNIALTIADQEEWENGAIFEF